MDALKIKGVHWKGRRLSVAVALKMCKFRDRMIAVVYCLWCDGLYNYWHDLSGLLKEEIR